jgi:hypothetical protein
MKNKLDKPMAVEHLVRSWVAIGGSVSLLILAYALINLLG